MRINVVFVLLVLFAVVVPARAQTVSLITFGPGEETFEKFGHTALRLRDDKAGYDVIYNWGLFEAEGPVDLLTRFIQGRLQYSMGGYDGPLTLEGYAGAGRSIWEQELNLTPGQAIDLLRFVAWNERPANRYYNYDYYQDNCTTRVRDAIDKSVGGAIGRATKGVKTGTTYRDHTRRTLASVIPLYTALQTVLGPRVDHKLDQWDESFLPFQLQRHVRSVTVFDAAGNAVPLVKSEVELTSGKFAMPATKVPLYWPFYAIAGVTIGALLIGAARWAKRAKVGRLAMFALVVGWSLLAGIGGAIMLFGWVATDHVAAYRNENLLQTNPLLLLVPLLTFMGLVGTKWARRAAAKVAVVIAALSVVGLMLKVLPLFRQVNGDIIALALPINVGLAWALRHFAIRRSETGDDNHDVSPNASSANVL